MSDNPKHNVLITNLTMNDDAFAVLPENGEGVYIPPGVTRAANLIAGEFRMVTVVPNNPDRQNHTKWMGIYVDPPHAEQSNPDHEEMSALREKILLVLDDKDIAYLTTGEAAREMGVDVLKARGILNKLFNELKVARADVYYGSSKRAVHVLWSMNPEGFL